MTDSNNTSRFARITWWLAIILLLALPISVLGIRLDILPIFAGLATFAISCLGAIALLIVLLVTALLPARAGNRTRDLSTGLVALVPALVSIVVFGGGEDVPAIHNITTDVANPPAFVAGVVERGDSSNPLALTPDVIALHTEAYPDLQPLMTSLAPAAAFDRALVTAGELGWEIYAEDSATGRIEAVDTTFWFGFKDDIVIRIRPTAAGSVLDLRSVSRVGQSDLGANANRIRNFINAFGD